MLKYTFIKDQETILIEQNEYNTYTFYKYFDSKRVLYVDNCGHTLIECIISQLRNDFYAELQEC